jgi:hypothetical protein
MCFLSLAGLCEVVGREVFRLFLEADRFGDAD